jgi:hypothetical protein
MDLNDDYVYLNEIVTPGAIFAGFRSCELVPG